MDHFIMTQLMCFFYYQQEHPSCFKGDESKKIIRNYNQMAKVLTEFELLYHMAWKKSVDVCTNSEYGRFSKLLNTSSLPKRPKQTDWVQTQTRQKQSVPGSSLFAILTSILWISVLITSILFEIRKRKVFEILDLLTYIFVCLVWCLTS